MMYMKKLIKNKKKKKKDFTLIELLAVILILGIIALIAVPTVNSVIEQARKDAYETSVDNVVKAINQYIISAEINGEEPLNGVYQISELKDILDMKNIDDLDGWVEIKGETITSYSFSNEKYVLTSSDDKTVTQTISKMESSTLKNNFPFKTDYSDKIVNAYITYGSKPDNAVISWGGSDDGKIDIYLVENNDNSSLYDLYIVSLNKIVAPSSIVRMFINFTELKKVVFDNFDTSNVINMSGLFREDVNLEYVNVEKFDTSNAKDISYMFWGCESLRSIDVSNWDTRNVTAMNQIFHGMKNLESLDLSKWDTSKVTSFAWLFTSDYKLSEIKGLEDLNTSNVTNFAGALSGVALKTLDLSKWDTSKGTSMWQMLAYIPYVETIDISGFDTSNVTDMHNMFAGCTKLKTIYVGNKWDTSKVETSTNMFKNVYKIVGASAYDENKIDVSMANYENGYLTLKS